MWTITLRQEIIDTAGQSIKMFNALQYSAGKNDMQMYWFKGADGSSMHVNRNNILSIVSIEKWSNVNS